MSADAPQDLVETAIVACDADGCVAVLEEHSEANLRWAANSLTTNGRAAARTMTVISIDSRANGCGLGIASRSVVDSDEARALARASAAMSRRCATMEDVSPLAASYASDDGWADDVVVTDPGVFEPRLTPALASAFAEWKRSDRLLFGFAEHWMTTCFLATSTGLRRRVDQPDGRLEITGKAMSRAASAWYGRHTTDFTTVDVPGALDLLGTRLAWAAKTLHLPPGRYETILPPAAVADLMLCAYRQASAREAHEGRTVFAVPGGADRIGERLSPLPLTLYSDPYHPTLRCAPFGIVTAGETALESVFDNGEPLNRTLWIDRGHLSNLVRTRTWARRTQTRPSPMIGNLILDGDGDASLDEMIGATDRGLLLTSLWYIRDVDPRNLLVTGLTRDGVYLVEGGRVTGAVNNFRFNESPIDLLTRTIEAGRTEDALPRERADAFRRTAMPPLRISDFAMSSVSDAH